MEVKNIGHQDSVTMGTYDIKEIEKSNENKVEIIWKQSQQIEKLKDKLQKQAEWIENNKNKAKNCAMQMQNQGKEIQRLKQSNKDLMAVIWKTKNERAKKGREVCKANNEVVQYKKRIAELEEQLQNAIVPKLIEGCKYFAVCSLVKEEVCPICNGNFRKMAIENGFRGELKCSNCDCGKISKIEWQIIPFTLKYAHYDKDGNVSYDNEVTIDCELSGYQHFSGGLYLDDNSDYMSSWQYKVCEEEKIFATKEEALAKLEELKGENK